MSIGGNTEHKIWRDYRDPEIIRIRCGHVEIPLAKIPKFCPCCGENVEDENVN